MPNYRVTDNVNNAPAAIIFSTPKVKKPKDITSIAIPTEALEEIRKRWTNRYQKIIKEHRHAASVSDKLKRTFKRNYKVDTDASKREKERLKQLRGAFFDTKKYLQEAKNYFEGCEGIKEIEGYDKTLQSDFSQLQRKKYINIDEMEALASTLKSFNKKEIRKQKLSYKEFHSEKYNPKGFENVQEVKDAPTYLGKMKNAYEYIYNKLLRIVNAIIVIGGHGKRGVNKENANLIERIFSFHHNNTADPLYILSNDLDTLLTHFKEEKNKFAKYKDTVDKIDKKYEKYHPNIKASVGDLKTLYDNSCTNLDNLNLYLQTFYVNRTHESLERDPKIIINNIRSLLMHFYENLSCLGENLSSPTPISEKIEDCLASSINDYKTLLSLLLVPDQKDNIVISERAGPAGAFRTLIRQIRRAHITSLAALETAQKELITNVKTVVANTKNLTAQLAKIEDKVTTDKRLKREEKRAWLALLGGTVLGTIIQALSTFTEPISLAIGAVSKMESPVNPI